MGGLRYFGGAVAFGFAAVWITASLAAALVCLLAAFVGYGVIVGTESARARPARRRRPAVAASTVLSPPLQARDAGDLPSWADALNSDLGHVHEPAAATSPLAREAEYGWPLTEDTVVAREAFH